MLMLVLEESYQSNTIALFGVCVQYRFHPPLTGQVSGPMFRIPLVDEAGTADVVYTHASIVKSPSISNVVVGVVM